MNYLVVPIKLISHNKSVMFARKNTRAGTGLRAAPARPIHWRYVSVLAMELSVE